MDKIIKVKNLLQSAIDVWNAQIISDNIEESINLLDDIIMNHNIKSLPDNEEIDKEMNIQLNNQSKTHHPAFICGYGDGFEDGSKWMRELRLNFLSNRIEDLIIECRLELSGVISCKNKCKSRAVKEEIGYNIGIALIQSFIQKLEIINNP